MKNLINNWVPETKSLVKRLVKNGFIIISGDNGEDEFAFNGTGKMTEFLDELLACDEARLYVQNSEGKNKSLYIVLGNSPGELVADYTVDPLLDKVTEEHYDMWSQRKQPMKESDY